MLTLLRPGRRTRPSIGESNPSAVSLRPRLTPVCLRGSRRLRGWEAEEEVEEWEEEGGRRRRRRGGGAFLGEGKAFLFEATLSLFLLENIALQSVVTLTQG